VCGSHIVPKSPAKEIQGPTILDLERVAVLREERGPVEAGRDEGLPTPRRLGALVGHLQKQEKCELLDVVAIREAVVAQDVAVGPELLDDLGRGVGRVHVALSVESK
jgi:hypothetical protein